jgi:hypothetical protein
MMRNQEPHTSYFVSFLLLWRRLSNRRSVLEYLFTQLTLSLDLSCCFWCPIGVRQALFLGLSSIPHLQSAKIRRFYKLWNLKIR